MKVKQVVGEHKKGFRAKKYARKPINAIAPQKPQGPVSESTPVAVGKVNAVNPDGTVSITDPQGNQINVDKQALVPGPNGTLTMTGSSTQAVAPGTQVMGSSEQSMEEGPEGAYPVQTGPQPTAQTGGRGPTPIVPSKLWTAITPDIEAKASAQGFRKVMLKHNGQLVPGLEGGDQQLGSKIIVAPSDFQSMSTPGAQTMRRPMGVQSAEKTGIGAPPMRESEDLTAMLKIAGLR